MGRGRILLLGGAALLAAAQCMPGASRTNPPVSNDLVAGAPGAPPRVRQILRGACYDCHSNETRWPWYSAVAPLSWWIVRHVNEGRRRLNCSEWDTYASDPETAAHKLDEIAKFVVNGEMAPWYYRALYPAARLTPEQRDTVARWVTNEARRLTQAR